MTAFIISTIVYFIALRLGKYLLNRNDIELPGFSKWLILNVFALSLAYVVTLPF